VREYTEEHYLPAAASYRQRTADHGVLGRKIGDWRRTLDQRWDALRFGSLRVNAQPDGHEVEIELFLNGINPSGVQVQLYANAAEHADTHWEMTRVPKTHDPASPDVYKVMLSTSRSIGDYTARVVPAYPDVSVPLECARIKWQR